MKKILFILILVSAGLAAASIYLFLYASGLKSNLTQSKNMISAMQKEKMRIDADKEKTAKESEKLQSDVLSYVALNTQLQLERDRLQKSLSATEEMLKERVDEFEEIKQNLAQMESGAKKKDYQYVFLLKEKEELQKQVKTLNEDKQREKALYHYNLGVVYAQNKLYDEAAKAYRESLKYDANNPDAYYNLGLLYGDVLENPQRAKEYYVKYLELKPDAEDRKTVEEEMERLGAY